MSDVRLQHRVDLDDLFRQLDDRFIAELYLALMQIQYNTKNRSYEWLEEHLERVKQINSDLHSEYHESQIPKPKESD